MINNLLKMQDKKQIEAEQAQEDKDQRDLDESLR